MGKKLKDDYGLLNILWLHTHILQHAIFCTVTVLHYYISFKPDFLFCCKITWLEDSCWCDQVHGAFTSRNFIWVFESVPEFLRKKWKDRNYVEGMQYLFYRYLMVINTLKMISTSTFLFPTSYYLIFDVCSYSSKCWLRVLKLTSILILFYWKTFYHLKIGGSI